MNSFEFFNPVKILYGAGETRRIGEETARLGRCALLVSYSNAPFFNDLFASIHDQLEKAGVACTDCFVASPNPTLSQARRAIEAGKRVNADVVLGVGGGSAMDLAKIVAAGLKYPHELRRMIRFSHSLDTQIPPEEALPLVLVPTLPATASEMNPTAVVTDDETMEKSYVWAPSCLYAKTAILDPELTLSLPAYQTACGAIDAISHVAEPFLFSNEETYGDLSLHDHLQLGLIKTIYENAPDVLRHPGDIQLRGVMQFSATIGLNGWLTCGVQGWTPMHQMGHVLSARYRATHGATLACMMPAWMRFFAVREDNARFRKFALDLYGTPDITEAADRLETYIRNMGVETRISSFGAVPDDLDALTESVRRVSFGADGRLASIPPINAGEVRRIFELAL